jgi:ABC-type transport system involved in multi-copper enzyme maturation permease subunit
VREIAVVFAYALRESVRRRIFHAGLVLTAAFLALYGLGCSFIHLPQMTIAPGIETLDTYAAVVVLGLAIFAIYFLGAALAIFLTISTVRGDAELGVLQAVIARPVRRWQFLFGRLLAAVAVSCAYVAVVFAATILITRETIGWTPRHPVAIGVNLGAGIALVALVSILSSIYLSGMANGIGVFMFFGAGLFGGLMGEIGSAINSHHLEQIAGVIRYLAPFEWFYQSSLGHLIEGETAITQTIVNLGPFGGSVQTGAAVWLWSLAYALVVGGTAVASFAYRDL